LTTLPRAGLRVVDINFPYQIVFPHPSLAETTDGVLCFSETQDEHLVLFAYIFGIFPWNNSPGIVHWWFTNPRFVLKPDAIHISGNLRKLVNSAKFRVSFDQSFDQVIECCANVRRKGHKGTWIHEQQMSVFKKLHVLGWAHSVEVWEDDNLVGGLYGLCIGKVFYGESMFHLVSGASKVAFVHLCQKLQELRIRLIDCQMRTDLLESFGANDISGDAFMTILKKNIFEEVDNTSWS